jgi:hypothetical protein
MQAFEMKELSLQIRNIQLQISRLIISMQKDKLLTQDLLHRHIHQ